METSFFWRSKNQTLDGHFFWAFLIVGSTFWAVVVWWSRYFSWGRWPVQSNIYIPTPIMSGTFGKPTWPWKMAQHFDGTSQGSDGGFSMALFYWDLGADKVQTWKLPTRVIGFFSSYVEANSNYYRLDRLSENFRHCWDDEARLNPALYPEVLQTLIQAPKGNDDHETAGDDLNVLNILSLLSQKLLSEFMPLFSFFPDVWTSAISS